MEPAFRPLDDPANRIDAMGESTRRKLAAWTIAVVLVVLAAAAIATPRRTPWRIASDGVHVDWVLCRGFAAGRDIDLAHAQAIDFEHTPEWRPARKESGYDGFGYNAGSFVLKNGQQVELYLARENKAVLLPVHNARPLLIGVADPQAFLAQARQTWKP